MRRFTSALVVTALSLVCLAGATTGLSGCAPSNHDSPKPSPLAKPSTQPDAPRPTEASCSQSVGVSHKNAISAVDALKNGRAFIARSFATFIAVTAPSGERRFAGIMGTLAPALDHLASSSTIYTTACSDTPMKEPSATVPVKAVIPHPEITIFNNSEYHAFQAIAPEAIWEDGTLDGSLIPTPEWQLGSGWRVVMTASEESIRTDIFSFKKYLDRGLFGGHSSLEIFQGTTKDSFVVVYKLDLRVNGQPVQARNEIEYVPLTTDL